MDNLARTDPEIKAIVRGLKLEGLQSDAGAIPARSRALRQAARSLITAAVLARMKTRVGNTVFPVFPAVTVAMPVLTALAQRGVGNDSFDDFDDSAFVALTRFFDLMANLDLENLNRTPTAPVP